MLHSLNYKELMERSLASFKANVGRTPGTMARAIISAINENIERVYDAIDQNLAMALISQAQGPFLEMIGEILDCHKLDDETYENYRYRITQQVYVAAGGNEQAIRLSLLQTPGVNNIKIKKYSMGTGTFTVFASIQSDFDYNIVVSQLQAKINEYQSLGIKGIVKRPTNIPIDLMIKLNFKDEANFNQQATIKNQVRTNIINYIEARDMGNSLVINDLRRMIMSSSNLIYDMRIIGLSINSVPTLLVNQDCYWDEKFVPNTVEIF